MQGRLLQAGSAAVSQPAASEPDFSHPPQSLEIAEPAEDPLESSVTQSGGPLRRLLWLLGYHSDEAITIRGATSLYEAVCEQADNSPLHDAVGMPPSFFSRWCLLSLHVWMLLVRLRADGPATVKLRQELYDLFQEDVEIRVRQQTSSGVSKYLVELEKDFYGSALALDQALNGEAELWQPVLRNVFGNDSEKMGAATSLAAYINRELQCLQLTSSDALLRGNIRFSAVK